MLLHVTLLVETLAAILTGIRSGVRVDEKMGGKSGRPLETFATLLTREHLLCTVHRP